MKSPTPTTLQKSLDTAYLSSSTAIYYESQRQPSLALEHWQRVLSLLPPPSAASHRPRNDAEAQLLASLKGMREQAEDRVKLLGALILSAGEAGGRVDGGAIGPPMLPERPSVVAGGRKDLPEPERKLRTTLRSAKKDSRRDSSLSSSPSSSALETLRGARGPRAATQAATLAWSSIRARGETGRPASERAVSAEEEGLPGAEAGPERGRTGKRSQSSLLPLPHEGRGERLTPPPLPEKSRAGRRRAQSSGLPLPHEMEDVPLPPPPPPPQHRVPVVRRKPLPRNESYRDGEGADGATPPPLPPKVPVERPERPRRIRTDAAGTTRTRNDSVTEGDSSLSETDSPLDTPSDDAGEDPSDREWNARVEAAIKSIGNRADAGALRQVASEIVVKGDEVHWDDVAGLEGAKSALMEAVVYPFLRPDLFSGLREPAKGMLLFGPPGTGKTMLARAVATESRCTFFSISASSLTSKYVRLSLPPHSPCSPLLTPPQLGESEKLVRALFFLAKKLSPSIIFVDEIDSLLSSRSTGENEATRRIKTEFLIQWSDLARAAAGKESAPSALGDPSRVLVLAATNLPWAIDEAARRRFARRQYIPLPEPATRRKHLQNLLRSQRHVLGEEGMNALVELTEGFSGSDITALAKDAAMGPLRKLGDRLLSVPVDEIAEIGLGDFEESLKAVRPSVGEEGLKRFEEWAEKFGERV